MALEYTQQVDRYVFRKPLWKKVLPFFLLLAIWAIPTLLWKGHLIKLPEPFTPWPGQTIAFLNQWGIHLHNSTLVAAVISALVLFWWYKAFEILIISAEAITRCSLLGFRTSLRWVDVDEVLIDHLEARMEGDVTARKTLYLYEIPKGIFGLRRRMKVNNRQFDGFEDVERIAVLVSVPAVAERLRRKLEATRKPITFSLRQPGETAVGVLTIILGLAMIVASFYDPLWLLVQIPQVMMVRAAVIAAGVLVALYGVAKFFDAQIGIDSENVYSMRYRWIMKRIPIDNIADIQIRDNQLRIYAFVKDPEIPKQVYKTNRYVRNRGVMLRLIREIYDMRRSMDSALIPVAGATPTPLANRVLASEGQPPTMA